MFRASKQGFSCRAVKRHRRNKCATDGTSDIQDAKSILACSAVVHRRNDRRVFRHRAVIHRVADSASALLSVDDDEPLFACLLIDLDGDHDGRTIKPAENVLYKRVALFLRPLVTPTDRLINRQAIHRRRDRFRVVDFYGEILHLDFHF